MSATNQREAQRPSPGQAMVVVDDIAARLHVRPTTDEYRHRYDRAAIAAAMTAALNRHLGPDLRVDADGTVWCHSQALAEHGFAPDEATGLIARRAAARWEEIIVACVDLAAVERAGQRTHVHATAAAAVPGQLVAVSVNGAALEEVDPDQVGPALEARWERTYGIGAAAAIRTAASTAGEGGAGTGGQVCAPVTWPALGSPWVTITAPSTR